MDETQLFVDLGLLLLAALGGGLLAQVLRQPLIVGYVLAGILVGPFTPGPTVSDPRSFRLFAEIGVILLMFSIGVDFSIGELLRVRRVALQGALGGIALIVLLTVPVGALLAWPLTQSIAVGAAISVASTMVLLKFLLERGELDSPHGRVAVGISLIEDLAVVAMVILLPVLGAEGGSRVVPLGRGLLQAVLLLAPLLWFARRVFPEALARVARTRNTELFLLVVVVVAIGTAALTASLGLSLALGAFLAGLVISESEFAHETLARVLPIRDVFVAVFFVSVGMFIRPASLVTEWATVLALVLLVAGAKFALRAGIVRGVGYDRRTAVLTGLSLAQTGEFSYVLAGVALTNQLITEGVYNAVLATSIVTILINAAVFRRVPRWVERVTAERGVAEELAAPTERRDGHVIIFGYGRVGREVADALVAFNVPFAVVDLDPEATRAARAKGALVVFGDAGTELILRRAGVERARLAVVVIPEFEAAHRCVHALRRIREDLPILARLHQQRYRALLAEAGATEVVQPEVEAALTLVRHSLDRLGVDHQEGRRYLEEMRGHWPEAYRAEAVAEAVGAQEVVLRNPALAGRTLRDAAIRERSGATIVTLRRGDREMTNPAPEEMLQPEDRIFAIGTAEQLALLTQLCEGGGDGEGFTRSAGKP